nr:esterase FE4-like [Onthophagus taurus]
MLVSLTKQAQVVIFLLAISTISDCYGYHQHSKRQEESLIVQTTKGRVIGKNDQTETGVKYFSFQGIPYAKPPLNQLRFEPPQEFSWNDELWNATYERNECVQAFPGFYIPISGREDCLYLNVYTRSKSNKNLKPVMVWIHGGSYVFGSGNKNYYSPEYFLDKDMVVVNINYRLGVFGFLSTGDEIIPGNMGLKDTIVALKWIKENIEFFGGNPSEVTIMGESSGAESVGYLIQSESAQGLFKRGILQSWTPINGLVRPEKMRNALKLLGEFFGVNGNNQEIINKLKTVDFSSLHLYSIVLTEKLRADLFDESLFGAVLEKETSKLGVITQPPYEQVQKCNFESVPIIIGFNSEESLTYEDVLDNQRYTYINFDVNPETLVAKDMDVKGRCDPKETGKKIKDHYAGRDGSFVNEKQPIIRYVSDILFMKTAVEYSKLYSKCNQNVYLYRFSYVRNKTATGAGHTDELRYLFPTYPLVTIREPLTVEEQKVSKNIVSLWSNFMKTGNPTPTQSEFNINWNKSTAKNQHEYLDIDIELAKNNLNGAPFKNDFDLWENLYKTCGKVKGI